MRIHDTKLQYGVENQSVLMQERKYNIRRVSSVVPNRMQKMRITNSCIYFTY